MSTNKVQDTKGRRTQVRHVPPLIRGPIIWRLLAFNILVVFTPVAGFLSLSFFEDRMRADLESSMVQQGRILAAWLGSNTLDRESAVAVLDALQRRHTARIRILDADGVLLADSAVLGSYAEPVSAEISKAQTAGLLKKESGEESSYPDGRNVVDQAVRTVRPLVRQAETTFLYHLLSAPVRFLRTLRSADLNRPVADYYSGSQLYTGSEVLAARSGRYGAAWRVSAGGQTSVTMYSALPVFSNGRVSGVVLVSQSTLRVMRHLYELRLEIGRIFVWSLAAAIAVSLFLALTISRPLARLKREAEAVTASGRLPAQDSSSFFHQTGRGDEIDRLSGAFSRLVTDLRNQIALSEQFACDAAHELRNRIAGIRTASELLADATPDEAALAARLIRDSAGRMERIVSDLRELSRIEADTAGPASCQLAAVLEQAAEACRARSPEVRIELPDPALLAGICPVVSSGHLEICIGNLLDNAVSFSPAGSAVTVEVLAPVSDRCNIIVRDRGPGLPEEHLDRIFERFFSWRPHNGTNPQEDAHTGIGLALVSAVARRSGGSVRATNHPAGGAIFTLELPIL